MTSTDVALWYVESINQQNAEVLDQLTSDGIRLIDAENRITQGKIAAREAWDHTFSLFPDYEILILETFTKDHSIMLLGTVSGTYAGATSEPEFAAWKCPIAIRVEVVSDQIAEWRTFYDLRPSYQALGIA